MSELVRRTGLPATTIHYYRYRGLLPEPHRAAPNRFLYDGRHEDALHVITFLRRRRGMSLAEIAELLPELLEQEGEEAFALGSEDLEARVPVRVADSPRERILRRAAEAFVAEDFAAVNLDDVATAAGVAKGSVYRHFESKEALFAAVLDWVADEIGRGFGEALAAHEAAVDEASAAHALAELLDRHVPLFADLCARAIRRPQPYAMHGLGVWTRLTAAVASHLVEHSTVDAGRAANVVVQAFAAVLGRLAGQLGVRPFSQTRLRRA